VFTVGGAALALACSTLGREPLQLIPE